MSREADDAAGIDSACQVAACAKSEFQSLRRFVVGYDNDDRLLGGAGEEREIKGAGRVGETRHTSATDTEREVPSHAIKGGGLLQFRENFADKREDHAVPILPVTE